MTHLLVHHKVQDFDTWKAAYDRHASARNEAGLTELHLLRNVSDPNDVVILFQAKVPHRASAPCLHQHKIHRTSCPTAREDRPDHDNDGRPVPKRRRAARSVNFMLMQTRGACSVRDCFAMTRAISFIYRLMRSITSTPCINWRTRSTIIPRKSSLSPT